MESYDETRPWQHALPELLAIISARADCAATYVTFACVCKSWRAAAKVAGNDFVSSQPPMLVKCYTSKLDILNFRSLAENKTYYKHIQGLHNLSYIGHSHGFLMMMDSQKPRKVLVILNPFNGARIEIVIPEEEENVIIGALSAPPTSPTCLLFLLTSCRALYRRLNSSSWTSLPLPENIHIQRVLIIKTRVYAQTHNDLLAVMDIADTTPAPPTFKVNPIPPCRIGFVSSRIMEIGGKVWTFDWQSSGRIEMYRLDSSAENYSWTRGDLGDRSLFVCWKGCQAYEMSNCMANEIISGRTAYTHDRGYYFWPVHYNPDLRVVILPCSTGLGHIFYSEPATKAAWLSPKDYI